MLKLNTKILKVGLLFITGILASKALFYFLDNHVSLSVIEPEKIAPSALNQAHLAAAQVTQEGAVNLGAAGLKKEIAIPELELSGLAVSGSESWAVINGRVVRLGDTVKGAKITGIYSNRVELEFEGEISTLTLR